MWNGHKLYDFELRMNKLLVLTMTSSLVKTQIG